MQTSKEKSWVRVVEAYLDFVSMTQSGLLLIARHASPSQKGETFLLYYELNLDKT